MSGCFVNCSKMNWNYTTGGIRYFLKNCYFPNLKYLGIYEIDAYTVKIDGTFSNCNITDSVLNILGTIINDEHMPSLEEVDGIFSNNPGIISFNLSDVLHNATKIDILYNILAGCVNLERATFSGVNFSPSFATDKRFNCGGWFKDCVKLVEFRMGSIGDFIIQGDSEIFKNIKTYGWFF
jgi:hypothetical protein